MEEKQNISMKEMLTKRSFEPITNCNCIKDREKQIEEIAKIISDSTEIDTIDYYKARVKAKEIIDYFNKNINDLRR